MDPVPKPKVTLMSSLISTQAIRQQRPSVERPLPGDLPLQVLEEWEAVDATGQTAHVTTIFLRGSECRFTCLMCDLWRHTHQSATAPGAIPAQIASVVNSASQFMGLSETHARWVKLYNAASFFDSQNIPPSDLSRIAPLLEQFGRVIVENHPCLLPWSRIRQFQAELTGRLEIAMGLETVEPQILRRLNKRMRIEDFSKAVKECQQHNVDVRAFVLLQLPWLAPAEALAWCCRSIDTAIQLGVRHVSVIPMRIGNGAMDTLAQQGFFEVPRAAALEKIMQEYWACTDSLVTVDTWDWTQLAGLCAECSMKRRQRLVQMNTSRKWLEPISCAKCHEQVP
jgi:radical SAM enzyme (TIGR01210 family)